MTKQEILKAIDNGESVWVNGIEHKLDKYHFVAEYNNEPTLYLMTCGYEEDDWNNYPVEAITNIYKTKAEAEHYLHHANVTRTEQLPFYTFSEIAKDEKNFKMGKTYTLIEDKNFVLDINKSYVSQIVLYTGKEKYSWNFNEENFYKAYDECVRLFKGE